MGQMDGSSAVSRGKKPITTAEHTSILRKRIFAFPDHMLHGRVRLSFDGTSGDLRQRRLVLIMLIYALAALLSARNTIDPVSSRPIDILISLFLSVSFALVCAIDSRLRGKPLPIIAPLLIAVLWPLAVPMYLVGSRGWRGLRLLLLHTGLVCLVSFAVFLLLVGLGFGDHLSVKN
jgi:hypothetical protein